MSDLVILELDAEEFGLVLDGLEQYRRNGSFAGTLTTERDAQLTDVRKKIMDATQDVFERGAIPVLLEHVRKEMKVVNADWEEKRLELIHAIHPDAHVLCGPLIWSVEKKDFVGRVTDEVRDKFWNDMKEVDRIIAEKHGEEAIKIMRGEGECNLCLPDSFKDDANERKTD